MTKRNPNFYCMKESYYVNALHDMFDVASYGFIAKLIKRILYHVDYSHMCHVALIAILVRPVIFTVCSETMYKNIRHCSKTYVVRPYQMKKGYILRKENCQVHAAPQKDPIAIWRQLCGHGHVEVVHRCHANCKHI